jgi:hypothetical protein
MRAGFLIVWYSALKDGALFISSQDRIDCSANDGGNDVQRTKKVEIDNMLLV